MQHVWTDPDDEERLEAPLERPAFLRALLGAATDLYLHSVRLVPANFLWALVLVGVLMATITGGVWFTILTAPFLGLPLVGVYRLAGLAARGRDPRIADIGRGIRDRWRAALVTGFVVTWITLLLTINVVTGFSGSSPLGWGYATVAFWILVAAACVAVVAWPILGDPDRPTLPLREVLRLSVVVALASALRIAVLAVVVGALLVVSTIAFALIVSVAVAFVALLSSRIVLPEADRIERLRRSERGDGP